MAEAKKGLSNFVRTRLQKFVTKTLNKCWVDKKGWRFCTLSPIFFENFRGPRRLATTGMLTCLVWKGPLGRRRTNKSTPYGQIGALGRPPLQPRQCQQPAPGRPWASGSFKLTILFKIITRMKLLVSNYLGDYSYRFQGSSELISITVTVSLVFLQNAVTGK